MWKIPAGSQNPLPLNLSLENPDPGVVSPDGSAMLLRSVHGSTSADQPLYFQPLPSGTPHRVGDILDYDAAWTPDGKHIIFGKAGSVYLTDKAGQGTEKLFDVPGRAFHFRWSRKGTLRFSVYNPQTVGYSIWQQDSLGKPPYPFDPGLRPKTLQCCGEWNADSSIYFFQAVTGRSWHVFARNERSGFWRSSNDAPVQLTSGFAQFTSPLPLGDRLLVLSIEDRREVVRYDPKTSQWAPLLEGVYAGAVAFSGDDHWLVYTRTADNTLWRCEMPKCRNPVQLTFEPLRVTMPRLSSDGSRIAFMAKQFDKGWQAMWVAPRGGPVHKILENSEAQGDPSWSPDGRQVAVGSIPGFGKPAEAIIRIVDVATGQAVTVNASEGKNTPLWSPNGRKLAAVRAATTELTIYDFETKRWSTLPGPRAGYLNWSLDSKHLFFRALNADGSESEDIDSLDIDTFHVSRAASQENVLRPATGFGGWVGLGPGDTPLAVRDLTTGQLLSWRVR